MITNKLTVAFSILLFMQGLANAQTFGPALTTARTYTVKIWVSGTPADKDKDKDKGERYGTGVVLRTDGFIATAAHVVGQNAEWAQSDIDGVLKRSIKVTIADSHGNLESNNWRDATFFKDNARADVTIIKINGIDFLRAECRSLKDVNGSKIFRLGFPATEKSWADGKGGDTGSSRDPLNFTGNLSSDAGMSGGPAIDSDGRVLGLALINESDPRSAMRGFTEFVRIEEAYSLLPNTDTQLGCRMDSRSSSAAPVDVTPQLASPSADTTVSLQFPDQTIVIKPGTYNLDGRSLRIKARSIVLEGDVVIRSYGEQAKIPTAQAGDPGKPGGQGGGDGQNGAIGLEGSRGGNGAPGRPGAGSGPITLDFNELLGKEGATLTVVANGQSGGPGGAGGTGGPGGPGGAGRNRGGNAFCGGAVSPGNGGPGGKGGVGGPGGAGGGGGSGGHIEYAASLADAINDKRLVLIAPGGRGGSGGQPGQPGSRGSGGAAGGSSHCGGGGQRGADGPVGDPGSAGTLGQLGPYGDIRGL